MNFVSFCSCPSSLHDNLKRSQVLSFQTWNRRKSYETHLKLKVVEFAAQKGNRAAGRHFGVGELLVQAWRKDRQVGAVVSETNLPVMLVMVANHSGQPLRKRSLSGLTTSEKVVLVSMAL